VAALREGSTEVEVERITLPGEGGEPVEAIHARPTGMPTQGLVLHPDIMGVRPLFDDLSRRLATYALLDEGHQLDAGARMARVKDLDDETQIGNLDRAANWLVVHDDVSEVAVLGFCMGGMYALKAAATGRFDRAVAFYGMIRVPDDWRSPNLREPLETATEVCPTLAIFGSADSYTPAADITALRDAWSDRPDCEVVVYEDAEHGFVHDAERPAHRAEDAADAWARVLRFLGVESGSDAPTDDSLV
jgi:carboxymethylenebutenolidase